MAIQEEIQVIEIKSLSKQFKNETAIDYKDLTFETGKSYMLLTGEVAAVESAIAKAKADVADGTMFLDSTDRMIYFRDKRTRKEISLVEVCSGI